MSLPWRLAAAGATLAVVAVAAVPAMFAADRPRRPQLAPVGIVSAVGYEQAPILAAMRVSRTVRIEGYTFYVGTIDGKPVVDTLGYEDDESAQMATYLLAKHFKPRAIVFSGTGGAQSPRIHVGDVVLGGFVADKSNIHYNPGGYQTTNKGVQVHTGARVRLAGAVIAEYGHPVPTPRNARGFGYGPSSNDRRLPYVEAFAATRQLARLGQRTRRIGSISKANATGDENARGRVANKVVTGVMGQAQTWTEPLAWIAAQNFLYQSDVEENEGSGFAFASATRGVPWMMVRGISDTPWFPNAYEGTVAARRAARVAIRIATRLPAKVKPSPIALDDLSATANASRAGYLIAGQAFFDVGEVTRVSYADTQGNEQTLEGEALARMREDYRPAAGALP
jgi:adenosylhomocysteine nucleosidase